MNAVMRLKRSMGLLGCYSKNMLKKYVQMYSRSRRQK